jgi:hypothetical protein
LDVVAKLAHELDEDAILQLRHDTLLCGGE